MDVPLAIAALLLAYFIYLVLSAYLMRRKNAAKALELKCEDPPLQKNRWPLGLDNLKRALAA
jgi:hypothetical protein